MASDEREAPAALTRLGALAASPQTYHLFHALRVIEATYPDRPRLGRSRRVSDDPVRLGQEVELAFPPSTIADFTMSDRQGRIRLTNRMFGLFGPNGPLPLHMTEYARDRLRNKQDPTFAAFADVFHHRMLSLFYRAWASAEPAPSADRPDDDRFAQILAAMAGQMGRSMADRDAMPDIAKRHFTGRFSQDCRSEEGLLALVSTFFRAPAKIETFVGSWLELEPDDRWMLGSGALGRSTGLGSRVWSREAKFRIRLGPLGLADYRRLLPGGDSLERLSAIVRNYVGEVLDWDLTLVLAAEEVPDTQLGAAGRLGQTTWIGQREPGRDADDLHLRPPPVRRRAPPPPHPTQNAFAA
ncbi:MAG: type VI secretion system baseplate subunit TssG [Pseudomonadota bacterium]